MLHTGSVRYTKFRVRKYSRLSVPPADVREHVYASNERASVPAWEHMSLQPIWCCVAEESEAGGGERRVLSVEWVPPRACGGEHAIAGASSAPHAGVTLVGDAVWDGGADAQEYIDINRCSWAAKGAKGDARRPCASQLDVKAVYAGDRVAFRCKRRDAGFHRFQVQFMSVADAEAFIASIEVRSGARAVLTPARVSVRACD